MIDVCPCGAPAQPDSLYCGYDCEPTHEVYSTDLLHRTCYERDTRCWAGLMFVTTDGWTTKPR